MEKDEGISRVLSAKPNHNHEARKSTAPRRERNKPYTPWGKRGRKKRLMA